MGLHENHHTSPAALVIGTNVAAPTDSSETWTNPIAAIWASGCGPAASVPSGTGVARGTDSDYTWANAGDAIRTSLGHSTTATQVRSPVA